MKKSVIYCRVSTDEQATGYSLGYQEERLLKNCEQRQKPSIVFRDDASAKTIEGRPELLKAIQYIKAHKGEVDEFLVLKWDRFSRSTHDAYVLIRLFEDMGITVQAIEQPIDFSIPEQAILLAVYLSTPESENRRRSLNIRAGNLRAMKIGRWVTKAPMGYSYQNQNGQKHLIPNSKAPIVLDMFKEFSTGNYSIEQIRTYINTKYALNISKTQFPRMLKNQCYTGLISYTEKSETHTVEACHTRIVDRATFSKVQNVLDGKFRKLYFNKVNDEFPLRGILQCPDCSPKLLTASFSKGRHGGRFPYYHCKSPCRTRIPSKIVNTWIVDHLKSIKIEQEWCAIVGEQIRDQISNKDNSRKENLSRLKSLLKGIDEKLVKLTDKLIAGVVDEVQYKAVRNSYAKERDEIQSKILVIGENNTRSVEPLLQFCLDLFQHLDSWYLQLETDKKLKLLNAIFPQKIIFSKSDGRTPFLNPALAILRSNINALRAYKKMTKQ